jgi:hypothetical protein
MSLEKHSTGFLLFSFNAAAVVGIIEGRVQIGGGTAPGGLSFQILLRLRITSMRKL